ncbi:hypothetical protein [Aquihabitans sp. McL0605]|uniref:hypothetical protein n=1 Tax=Aquihabitans sp. McL0605 TaxID=3415671 RepID=UPI003CFA5CF2
MTRRLRPIALVIALAAVLAACGTSGGDGSKATTTTSAAVSTTAPTASTTGGGASTTAGTTGSTPAALPACQDLLQEYTDRFTPDDLSSIASFFREYAPLMPAEVRAASLRIATAYERAGDLTKLNLADTDLTADAQTFSDWLTAGCPAG